MKIRKWLRKHLMCPIGIHQWRYFSGIPRNEFMPASVLRQCKICRRQQRYDYTRHKWEKTNY